MTLRPFDKLTVNELRTEWPKEQSDEGLPTRKDVPRLKPRDDGFVTKSKI